MINRSVARPNKTKQMQTGLMAICQEVVGVLKVEDQDRSKVLLWRERIPWTLELHDTGASIGLGQADNQTSQRHEYCTV